MYTLKQVVFIFCISSFSAGILLHLFPEATAKRCMKAVAGLYVLSVLFASVQNTDVFAQDILSTIAQMQPNITNTETNNDFETALIKEAKDSLSRQYNEYLQAEGYDATVEISLTQKGGSMVVTDVSIQEHSPLTAEEKTALSTYFVNCLAVDEVVFLNKRG